MNASVVFDHRCGTAKVKWGSVRLVGWKLELDASLFASSYFLFSITSNL
jgi:hypothetical protein